MVTDWVLVLNQHSEIVGYERFDRHGGCVGIILKYVESWDIGLVINGKWTYDLGFANEEVAKLAADIKLIELGYHLKNPMGLTV